MLNIEKHTDEVNLNLPKIIFTEHHCTLTRNALNYLGKPHSVALEIYRRNNVEDTFLHGETLLVISQVNGRRTIANKVNYSMGAGVWYGESAKQLKKLLDYTYPEADGIYGQMRVNGKIKKCVIFEVHE